MGQIDIHFYVWMFFRRLPYIILITFVGAIAGVLIALQLPPTFVGVAKVLVESPRLTTDLARSAIQTNVVEQLQVIEQKLTTRASLLEMAKRFDVYPDLAELSENDVAIDMHRRTSVQVVALETPRGSGGALVFEVRFEADEAELAARVANGYANSMVDANEAFRKDRAAAALDFIQQDVDRLTKELANAEAAITEFRNSNRESLPDTMEHRTIMQSSRQERLLQIQREEDSLRSRKLTLAQIYARGSGTGPVGISTPEDEIIAQLRRTLAEQRAVFAEDSPNILALRQRIQTLETNMRENRAPVTGETDASGMPADLQFQFADIDAQLKLLAAERQSLERQLTDLERSIKATAENTTILNKLDREYQNAQSQYIDARKRLAEALTGARIEENSIGQRLTLIEPAIVPESPAKPQRRIIAAGGAVGGFGLGIALILLIELWRSAIYRTSDIASIYEGEPLVAVPYIHRRRESTSRFRRAAAIFAFAVLCGSAAVQTERWSITPTDTAVVDYPMGCVIARTCNA